MQPARACPRRSRLPPPELRNTANSPHGSFLKGRSFALRQGGCLATTELFRRQPLGAAARLPFKPRQVGLPAPLAPACRVLKTPYFLSPCRAQPSQALSESLRRIQTQTFIFFFHQDQSQESCVPSCLHPHPQPPSMATWLCRCQQFAAGVGRESRLAALHPGKAWVLDPSSSHQARPTATSPRLSHHHRILAGWALVGSSGLARKWGNPDSGMLKRKELVGSARGSDGRLLPH